MKALTLTYQHFTITANREAWFNATQIATLFDKRPIDWLRLPETQQYIAALCKRQFQLTNPNEDFNCEKISQLKLEQQFIKTQRGRHNSGTWLHPKLAVLFARWLDIDFAIWCDEQINQLLSDTPKWNENRNALSVCTRLQNEALKTTLEAQGKAPQHYHYINEARLINHAMTGKYKALNREQLNSEQLNQLISITAYNLRNIYQGKSYQERKQSLNQALAVQS